MKKIFAVIPIAIIFILLSHNKEASAKTFNDVLSSSDFYQNAVVCKENDSSFYIFESNDWDYIIVTENMQVRPSGSAFTAYHMSFDPIMNPTSNFDGTNTSGYNISFQYVIYIKGNVSNQTNGNPNYYPSLEDFLNQPSNPSWWKNMWSELGEALGDPNFWFGEWFVDLIDNIFGNDEGGGQSEHSISTHVQIENPTITPAPTPIPYTTVVIPKTDPVSGDTYYETDYYYNNPSGTPIIQPYPPTNPPATNSPSNGNDYIPIGGDPYSIPVVNWLTSTTIGDSEYNGIDSVGSGLDSIDSIGSEYNDGMGAVQDATGTLPTIWLLLIGIAAAIPLIAGIISRFLS